MEAFLQQLVNGLTVGSVYALVAIGYTMVFGVMKLVNFAHGDLFMLGAYLALTALTVLLGAGMGSTVLAVILATVIGAGLVAVGGVVLERIAYRPLRKASRLAAVVSALGASIFIQNAVMLTYGPNYLVYPENLLPHIAWKIGPVELTLMRVLVLGISVALMVALYLFVQKTKVGTAMRAVALDHDTAKLMGIKVSRVIVLVFLIGSSLGAMGGIMVGLFYRQINFTMGWTYGMKAFTAAILGGIGNIPGAMVGGMLLGILETLGAGYIAASWKDAFAFLVLILILLVRPTGLLGERVAEKV